MLVTVAMASPLQTGKQSVDLAAGGVRVSRIRRDPPPVVEKKVAVVDPEERDARIVVIGVITFALAIAFIVIGFSSAGGWSPSEHTVHLNL